MLVRKDTKSLRKNLLNLRKCVRMLEFCELDENFSDDVPCVCTLSGIKLFNEDLGNRNAVKTYRRQLKDY